MDYCVYIIQSAKTGRFYTGMTNDLSRRITEHNKGTKGTLTTFNNGPYRLIHAEECVNRIEARKREIFWKSGKGREKIKTILETWWL